MKNRRARFYEVQRWNAELEKWEDVVVLACSENVAKRKVHVTRIRRVAEFQ